MRRYLPYLALLCALMVPACDSFGQAMTAHTNVVARAAGHELSVDQTAGLMARNPRLPAQAQVVDAVANLWVDYTLLATAAQKDSTLQSVNVAPLVKPALEQEVVLKLRDKVIHVDTSFTDAQLKHLYETEQPSLEIKARHILFRIPPDATPEQRDSVMQLAKSVRARAVAGEDFGKLAEKYSEDPGSKDKGGELGFFSRGQMVAPFEEAAFKLQPGEISDVVETPFGLHIIKVEEKKLPPFDQQKEEFRRQQVETSSQKAEQDYVKSLTEPLGIAVQDGAYAVVRDLAKQPEMKLSGRAASRDLVTYKGGALTAGEIMDLMRALPPNRRAQFGSATDDQLKNVLEGLTRNKILVDEAARQGFKPTQQERDSLAALAHKQLAQVVKSAGLDDIKPQQGETQPQALERKVMGLVTEIVEGKQNVIPLGPVAYALREQYGAEVYDRSVQAVVSKVEASRPAETPGQPGAAPAGQPPAPSPQAPAPKPAPDTTKH